jgi:hypothetical protein
MRIVSSSDNCFERFSSQKGKHHVHKNQKDIDACVVAREEERARQSEVHRV